MMIHVTKIDDLSFCVQFDPSMIGTLRDELGWTTPERALLSILSDMLLGPAYADEFGDPGCDVPL